MVGNPDAISAIYDIFVETLEPYKNNGQEIKKIDQVHNLFFERLKDLFSVSVDTNGKKFKPNKLSPWFNKDCKLTKEQLLMAVKLKNVYSIKHERTN